jgi:glycosyltransferase involved in cell wall biosynthesis
MPSITVLLHTENDALRLGRCLETVYPCDEIVIIDHGSRDHTVQIAKEYGARVIPAKVRESAGGYRAHLRGAWILVLDPRESLSESLAASLYEWKSEAPAEGHSFSIFLREETAGGWVDHPAPQTRLLPVQGIQWNGILPKNDPNAVTLEGPLLRFALP